VVWAALVLVASVCARQQWRCTGGIPCTGAGHKVRIVQSVVLSCSHRSLDRLWCWCFWWVVQVHMCLQPLSVPGFGDMAGCTAGVSCGVLDLTMHARLTGAGHFVPVVMTTCRRPAVQGHAVATQVFVHQGLGCSWDDVLEAAVPCCAGFGVGVCCAVKASGRSGVVDTHICRSHVQGTCCKWKKAAAVL
jgi:hypothetical protein